MQTFCKYATAFTGLFFGCENQNTVELQKQQFVEHVTSFGLSYDTTDEYYLRFDEWVKKDNEMNEINASQNSFQLGHNHFSTWTSDEYKQYIGNKWEMPQQEQDSTPITLLDESKVQGVMTDWRTKNAVNPVKNQGSCKSDWAFGAIAAAEGAHAIANGKLVSLSEQQLMDCAKQAGDGCNGGSLVLALYDGIREGFMTEQDYPYLAKQGDCHFDKDKVEVMVTKVNTVQPLMYTQMQRWIEQGPVAGMVDASSTVFQMYKSGILDDPKCGTNINQGVTIVGDGYDNQNGYMIVRNSWGTKWGEDGYIRIAAGVGKGVCGIQTQSYSPEAKKTTDNTI